MPLRLAQLHEPSSTPKVPLEVIREILAWAVRPVLFGTVTFKDGLGRRRCTTRRLSSEVIYPAFQDVHHISNTCSEFRAIVKELGCVHIAIRSRQELHMYLNLFEEETGSRETRHPGDRTISIEFLLPAPYDIRQLTKLLANTPNLLSYFHRPIAADGSMDVIPRAIIVALSTITVSLKHLYFVSRIESPTFNDIISLLRDLPSLSKLHVDCIYSYPDLPTFMTTPFPKSVAKSLTTLSLGVLRVPSLASPTSYVGTWDKFLTLLTHQDLDFPRLEQLVLPMFPSTPLFFELYGRQIKDLGTTTFYSKCVLSHALDLCPSLEFLSIDLCDEIPDFPHSLPSIRDLHIFPCIEGVCGSDETSFIHSCPIRLHELMEQIFIIDLPVAKRFTISTVGPFKDLDAHYSFMGRWRARWGGRGVRFQDDSGIELGQEPRESSS